MHALSCVHVLSPRGNTRQSKHAVCALVALTVYTVRVVATSLYTTSTSSDRVHAYTACRGIDSMYVRGQAFNKAGNKGSLACRRDNEHWEAFRRSYTRGSRHLLESDPMWTPASNHRGAFVCSLVVASSSNSVHVDGYGICWNIVGHGSRRRYLYIR